MIDADKVGHECYAKGTDTFRRVVEEFGERILAEDGSIDRQALGKVVFAAPCDMKRLTDIVWPAIAARLQDSIRTAAHLPPNGSPIAPP